MAKGDRWTAEEDRCVLEMPAKEVAEKFGRTPASVRARRYNLLNPQKAAEVRAVWKAREVKLLRKHYPVIERVKDLVPMLKPFTLGQIKSKAHVLKLRRKYFGDADASVEGHCELIDQIRIRSKQDGIALYKLDGLLKTGAYFRSNSYLKGRRANLHAVARAVEYFGGTLVIDWRDR